MSWLYRKTITVSHTQNQDAVDLLNYPLLINLSDPNLATTNFGGYVQYSSGSDITFTDGNNVLLDFEIESYNNATGTLVAWVRIPTFFKAIDTTIYIYFDNSAITTSQANPSGVWDGNYQAIYHVGNGLTLSLSDSTSKANTLTNNGTVTATTGQVDGGASFSGSNYLSAPVSALQTSQTYVTFEAWFNASNWATLASSMSASLIEYGFTGNLIYWLALTNNGSGSINIPQFGIYNGTAFTSATGTALSTGTWYHLVGTLNSTALTLYVNGVSVATATITGAPIAGSSSYNIGLGRSWFDSSTQRFLTGIGDEFRISIATNNSAAARSAGWILTQYNNQSSPGTFYTVGPLQQPPTIANPFWHSPRWILRPLVNKVFNATPSEPFPAWVDRALTANFVRPTTPTNIPGSVPRSLSATLVNYARNISTRLILAANQRLQDTATRFILGLANQSLKDIATRLRLMSANQLKDVMIRVRLMSTNQLKDVTTRFLLKTNQIFKDITTRFNLSTSIFANTWYGSNIAQSLGGLTQSAQLSPATGGTVEIGVTTTAPASGTNQYIELTALGGATTGAYVLPAPTGLGWSINLQGQTIQSGYWSGTLTLLKSGTPITNGTLLLRAWHRTYDGQYLPIVQFTLPASFSTTRTIYPLGYTLGAVWQFTANETLYIDLFALNGATAWNNDVFTVYVSNSVTQGIANDLVIQGPTVIATPPGPSLITAGGTYESILDQSITATNTVTGRSTLTITSKDVAASYTHPYGTPVLLSDSQQGIIYNGWLDSDAKTKVGPGQPELQHVVTGKDKHWLADKRANKTNYGQWTAGDTICDMVQQTLSAEGVWGDFALESDYTPATFGQGTLTNVVATTTTSPFTYAPNVPTPPSTTNTGDLELVRAGTQFTLTEQTTSDFSSGTLTNMTAANNMLTPTTQSAMKVIAQMALTGSVVNATANWSQQPVTVQTGLGPASIQEWVVTTLPGFISNSAYIQIWSGSQTIGSSDTFNYDLWIAGTSPSFMAGVDFFCSDGTQLTLQNGTLDTNNASGLFDGNNISVDATSDLSNYAKDYWYTRSIPLSGLSGKTITNVSLFITGSTGGITTLYVKNCYLGSAPGTPFFSTSATAPQLNPPVVTTMGAFLSSAITTSVIQVFNPLLSTRLSPGHSISSVGLVQNSTVAWTAALPTVGTQAPTYPPGTSALTTSQSASAQTPAMLLMVSYDQATWLPCTNNGALPGLPPGANVRGMTLYLREQFQASSDPSAIPSLEQVIITINSAAASPTSDIVTTYGTTTEWNTGTYNGTLTTSKGNLTLSTQALPMTISSAFSRTLYPPLKGVTYVTDNVSGGAYTFSYPINTLGNRWAQARLNAVAPLTDFTFTAQFMANASDGSGLVEMGIEYRQTGWSYANNTGAYFAFLLINGASANINLGYGTNQSGATQDGTFITIATVTVSATYNTYYPIKIAVRGNHHQVYFNNASTPQIDVMDNTYTSAGYFGLRSYTTDTTSGVTVTAGIQNIAITPAALGTWTSPATSLSALGTVGYNQICWQELNSIGASQTQAQVMASLDGGTTWQRCANGAMIPQLARGTNVSSKSLQLQIILYAATPLTSPIIYGLYVRVCGFYGTVTGTRISPVLSLSPVLDLGASNVMWQANTPTNTSVTVATAPDGATWTNVGNSGAGASIAGWTPRPSAYQDLFQSNSANNYTLGFITGGSGGTWTYNTAQSNIMVTGGSGATFIYNSITASDVELFTDISQSDSGGLVWRHVDNNNWYECEVRDGSSSAATQNQILFYKVSGGVRSAALSTAIITFTRGTFHRVKVRMRGGLICIYYDGQCVIAYLDTSPLAAGGVGFRTNGGTTVFYQLWAQPFGSNLSGQALWTKTTLSTSDPAQMPQVFLLVASVRGSSIDTGQKLAALHPVAIPFAALFSDEFDSIVRLSGDYFWKIQNNGKIDFGPRLARPGAFPLHSVDDVNDLTGQTSNKLKYTPAVKATTGNQLFRSQQIIINATKLTYDHLTVPDLRIADGTTTSWTVDYPIFALSSITINGNSATTGIQGINSGVSFYWQPGSNTISYDNTLAILPAGTIIAIAYTGMAVNSVITSNPTASTTLATVEQTTSGIVEDVLDAQTLSGAGSNLTSGMTTDQATTFSQGLLAHFGNVNAQSLDGTVMRAGLQPGTVVSVFIPELGLWNVQLPITQVVIKAWVSGANPQGVYYEYTISATNGPQVNIYSDLWFGF